VGHLAAAFLQKPAGLLRTPRHFDRFFAVLHILRQGKLSFQSSCFGVHMKKKTRKQRKSRPPVRNVSHLSPATHRESVKKNKIKPMSQPWLQVVSGGI